MKDIIFLGKDESDGGKLPSLPNPFINSKTILGVDKDNNGIRDDLDKWIADYGNSFNERMALREVFKSQQKLLLYAYNNDAISYQNETHLLFLRNSCLNNLVKMYRPKESRYLIDTLIYLVRNTNERLNVSQNVVRGGYEYSPPSGVIVRSGFGYLFCNFKLQNFDTIANDAKSR